jgi:hypothetical protein
MTPAAPPARPAGARAAPRSLLQAPTEPVQPELPMQPGAPAPEMFTPEMFTMVQPATVGAPIATQSLELRTPGLRLLPFCLPNFPLSHPSIAF